MGSEKHVPGVTGPAELGAMRANAHLVLNDHDALAGLLLEDVVQQRCLHIGVVSDGHPVSLAISCSTAAHLARAEEPRQHLHAPGAE